MQVLLNACGDGKQFNPEQLEKANKLLANITAMASALGNEARDAIVSNCEAAINARVKPEPAVKEIPAAAATAPESHIAIAVTSIQELWGVLSKLGSETKILWTYEGGRSEEYAVKFLLTALSQRLLPKSENDFPVSITIDGTAINISKLLEMEVFPDEFSTIEELLDFLRRPDVVTVQVSHHTINVTTLIAILENRDREPNKVPETIYLPNKGYIPIPFDKDGALRQQEMQQRQSALATAESAVMAVPTPPITLESLDKIPAHIRKDLTDLLVRLNEMLIEHDGVTSFISGHDLTRILNIKNDILALDRFLPEATREKLKNDILQEIRRRSTSGIEVAPPKPRLPPREGDAGMAREITEEQRNAALDFLDRQDELDNFSGFFALVKERGGGRVIRYWQDGLKIRLNSEAALLIVGAFQEKEKRLPNPEELFQILDPNHQREVQELAIFLETANLELENKIREIAHYEEEKLPNFVVSLGLGTAKGTEHALTEDAAWMPTLHTLSLRTKELLAIGAPITTLPKEPSDDVIDRLHTLFVIGDGVSQTTSHLGSRLVVSRIVRGLLSSGYTEKDIQRAFMEAEKELLTDSRHLVCINPSCDFTKTGKYAGTFEPKRRSAEDGTAYEHNGTYWCSDCNGPAHPQATNAIAAVIDNTTGELRYGGVHDAALFVYNPRNGQVEVLADGSSMVNKQFGALGDEITTGSYKLHADQIVIAMTDGLYDWAEEILKQQGSQNRTKIAQYKVIAMELEKLKKSGLNWQEAAQKLVTEAQDYLRKRNWETDDMTLIVAEVKNGKKYRKQQQEAQIVITAEAEKTVLLDKSLRDDRQLKAARAPRETGKRQGSVWNTGAAPATESRKTSGDPEQQLLAKIDSFLDLLQSDEVSLQMLTTSDTNIIGRNKKIPASQLANEIALCRDGRGKPKKLPEWVEINGKQREVRSLFPSK